MAFQCYIWPGQVSCFKCTEEQKGYSFQPGWTLKEKGKSKGKGKSKVKVPEKLAEVSHPAKKRKVEVLVPE